MIFFSLFVFYSLWQPSQPQIKRTAADTKFCAPMPSKNLATRKRRPNWFWTRSIWNPSCIVWAIPRYWTPLVCYKRRGCCTLSIVENFRSFNFLQRFSLPIFFLLFWRDNKISNVSSPLSFSLSSRGVKKLEEIEGRIESWSFLLIHAARCTSSRSCNHDYYACFSLGISRQRGNFRLAFINIPDYSFLSDRCNPIVF